MKFFHEWDELSEKIGQLIIASHKDFSKLPCAKYGKIHRQKLWGGRAVERIITSLAGFCNGTPPSAVLKFARKVIFEKFSFHENCTKVFQGEIRFHVLHSQHA